ncbi:Uncharacterized protein APZ42_003081, partial [Daphnia magna]
GSTICSTSGIGCAIGAPLAVFGASEATEGATGLYRQYQGQGAAGFNPVRRSLTTPVPLKVGASDGINRANSMFGVTVPRWQNPIINPLTNNVLLSPTAAQGVLVYGVTTKVPAVVEDVNKARGGK